MRYFAVLRTACAVVAACLLPIVAQGQKALVYCPVDIDDVGCRNISTAIAGQFPGGVYAGYNGTAGTVDLRVADLSTYALFVVPSLADDATLKPYALLRDPVVAGRLRTALTGRIAMWSGTPDLGTAASPNRTLKDQLMTKLATWARGNYTAAKGPGLLTFLDQSQPAADRYSWVAALTGRNVIADENLVSYANAKALTSAAVSVIGTGGEVLGYPNMATFGFLVPNGAAGIAVDAVGQTGSTVRGQVVMLTSASGTTAGAIVQTDKTYYAPATTVVITGSGWQPGETVSLGLHEELPVHADRTFTTVADGSGNIAFTGFAPEAHEIDIRFILTATGASSGLRTQTTFLEGTSHTASATSHNGAGSDILSLPKPGGAVAGDVLLAQVTFVGGDAITPTAPAGWALVRRENSGSALGQAIYWKVATASEPTSYGWNFGAPIKATGGIARYSNVTLAADGNPVVAHSGSSGSAPGTATTLVAPSLSTTQSSLVVTFFAIGANTTLSTPSSMTLRHQLPNPEGPGGPTIMASDLGSSASETGTHTSISPESGAWVAHSIALDWQQIGQGSGGRLELPVTRPAGVRAGDFLLANIAHRSHSLVGVTAPAGWNLIAKRSNTSPLTHATYWRVAGASDPLDVWTFSEAVKSVGVITAHKNIDTTNPVEAFATNPLTNTTVDPSTKLTAPSITTTTPGALIVALYAVDGATNINTPPAGMLLRYSIAAHDPFAAPTVTVAAAEAIQEVPGPTGVKTAVSAVSLRPVAQTIALRPRPLAAKLAFTTASHTGLVNECLGPITVQIQDALGRPASVGTATNLTLATDGAGGFFTTSGCTAPAGTTVTVDAGANAASFYYRATVRGSGAHRLDASASGLTSASQVQTINASVSPTVVGSVAASASTFGGTTDLSAAVSPAVAGSVTFFLGGSVTPIAASYNASTGVATAGGITHGLDASGSAYSVRAVFASADAAYDGSEATNAAALQVDKASQTISFDLSSVAAKYGDTPFTVAALATGGGSGNPVSFGSETPDACTVTTAGQVGVAAAALCTLTASQEGNTNYAAALPVSRSFTIATRPLTVTAAGVSKMYDATPGAMVVLADDRIEGDALTTGFGSATFADKNAGTGKAITVSGITVSGAAAANYTANTTATTFADITARSLTVTATGADKEYDGTSAATVTLADDRFSGDVVNTSYANAAFADGNVGTGKSITVDGISISGTDAANYRVNATTTASAAITARAVTGTIAVADKIYDGGTIAVATAQSLTGLLAGDEVTLAVNNAQFDDRNVGSRTVTATLGLSGAAAANYALTSTTATASAAITPKALIGSFTASSRIYDGTTAATVATSSLAGVIAGDAVTLEVANAVFDTRHVGPAKAVTATLNLLGAAIGNYTVNPTATSSADITPRSLAVTATGDDKTYDGNTTATVTLTDDRIGGDAFSTHYAGASFADKHVGDAKGITVAGITLSGPDAGNYAVASTTSASASITQRALAITATGADKVYDGSAAAAVTLSDDRLAGDALNTSHAGANFDDPSVGVGKRVTVSGISVTGADAGNYSFNTTATTSASIAALALTGAITADDKVYDGSTAAVAAGQPLSGLASGDGVTLSVSNARFDSRNVGSRTVTADISLAGPEAGNYVLGAPTATTTASIAAKALSGSFTAASKTYDGTSAATVATTSLPGVLSPDAVSLEVSDVSFDSKHVGAAKTVTGRLALSGADIGNYTVNATATSTASVTARMLTVSAIGESKLYDGTPGAVATLSDDRVAGDVVTTAYASASFADANAGTGKPVTVNGISLSGADAANYTFNTTATTSADISARSIAITTDALSKVYGDADPVLTYQVTSGSLVAGESFTGSLARVAGEAVSGSPYAIQQGTLTAGANYQLLFSGSSLTVTRRPVNATIAAGSKEYDGEVTATITRSTLENAIAEDEVGVVVGTSSFADKNVGAGKTVTATGLALVGAQADNYTLGASTAVTTADITARPLVVTASAQDKIYDGSANAAVTLADNRVAGDALTTQFVSAAFADKNVGTGKPVTVSGIALGGADQGNYTVNATAAATASITARPLVVSATGIDKVYDGTTAATVTLSDNRLAGDVFTAGHSSATFADANTGAGKPIAVSGIALAGTDAGNYAANTTANTSANISSRAIAVSIDAKSKVYGDADPELTYQVTGGSLLGGDSFTGVLARVAGETVAGGPYAIQQGTLTAGPNYALTVSGATLTVTRRAVSATIAVANKIYDGGVTATITGSTVSGAIAGDAVGVSGGTASFADKNVGTVKTVTATGLALVGAQADNYTLGASTAVATADITARQLIVSATGVDKTYDGTTSAEVLLADNRLTGDDLGTAYASASFADANVGTAKAITVNGISLSGTDAVNYSFNTTAGASAGISARSIAVTADDRSKVYGDPDPVLTYTVTSGSLVGGDSFSGELGRVAGETVDGGPYAIQRGTLTAGPNYEMVFAGAALTVTRRAVTPTIAVGNKVYDGGVAATITGSTLNGLVAGDDVGISATTATFADKNVGMGKAVTATGLTLVGTQAGNYALSSTTAGATADITARSLTVTAVGQDRTYDGTAGATVTLADDRIASDVLTTGYATASFADKNVGTAKSIVVNGITVTGSDAGNYAVNATAAATASITARPLVVSATGVDKVYDGTAAATVTLSDNRIAGDVITAGHSSATFADANVGTAKAITVNGISLTGNDAGNYAANTTANTSANISARAIAVAADAKSKVYGDADPELTYQVTSGSLLGGDSFAGALSRVAGETVAGGPYAIQQGTLTAGPNYALTVSGATLTVTRRAVSATIAVANKVYDGGVTATITGSTVSGAIAGDAVGVSGGTASFADKHVGTGKVVTATGLALVGAQADNYTLGASTVVATADITPRQLAVTVSAQNKIYDGNTIASVALADNRIPGDALTTQFGSAAFADKNVGTAKTVTVDGISLGGTDQGNYTVGTTATTTADITARALIISATGMNKVYDGTTAATVTLFDNRVSGDALTASYATASFADPAVGTGKAIGVNGITISGADAANYTFNTTATTTADITPRPVVTAEITLGNLSQRWDGTAKTATATTSPSGLAVTLTYTQNGVAVAAPTNAGFYDVLATISEPGYEGTTTGTLVILNLIDIMPGNSMNMISIGDTKTTEIAVAILGTATFDARTVVASSVTLGDGIGDDAPVNTSKTGALRASINDANGDGRADLVVYFKKTTVITLGNVTTATTELVIRGTVSSGSQIRGTDKVTVYP